MTTNDHECRVCDMPLIVGENTTQPMFAHHDYICQTCHREQRHKYYLNHRKQCIERTKTYRLAHSEQIHAYLSAHREHINKRTVEYRHRTGRAQPMSKNKECSVFLGVHVAERVLSHVFNGVERMPMNNAGYDFVCNNGYMIDAKSSCRRTRRDHADSWRFGIRKNLTADYFICLAFDNRKDLNPEHIWLIPAGNINDRVALSITESRLDKWKQYEIPIDKTITCCNAMKTEHTN